MADMVRLCPDGTVPLAVCGTCRALVLARDLEAHEAWHEEQERAAEERAHSHWETWHSDTLT